MLPDVLSAPCRGRWVFGDMMQQPPIELQYELTRRQRLDPHLKIWRQHALVVILCMRALPRTSRVDHTS